MRSRLLTGLLVVPVLALSACGGGDKSIDAATYTCAQFNKSLATKGDNTSGNYLNRLRLQAKLRQDNKPALRELELGVYFACRGKPGSTRPAAQAIATARQIEAGRFHLPAPTAPAKKKRSGK